MEESASVAGGGGNLRMRRMSIKEWQDRNLHELKDLKL